MPLLHGALPLDYIYFATFAFKTDMTNKNRKLNDLSSTFKSNYFRSIRTSISN